MDTFSKFNSIGIGKWEKRFDLFPVRGISRDAFSPVVVVDLPEKGILFTSNYVVNLLSIDWRISISDLNTNLLEGPFWGSGPEKWREEEHTTTTIIDT